QSSHQSTNHAAQKSLAHHAEAQLLSRLLPAGGGDRPARLPVPAAGEGEGGEIVPSWQEICRPRHLFEVDRSGNRGHEKRVERRDDGGAAQAVEILLAPGVLPGVESGGYSDSS